MNKILYTLVADNGRAKVFRSGIPPATLEMVYEQVNFLGKRKPSEVYADRPGRQQNDFGGSHSFAGERSTHGEEHFGRDLCKFLDAELREHKFDALILIAAPHFLGELRKHLGHECEKVLVKALALDMVKMPTASILEHLDQVGELTAKHAATAG